ncbi:MAG: RagB/SusD family nutrient uptake outer membrane protein [Reichenbachiella sp.]
MEKNIIEMRQWKYFLVLFIGLFLVVSSCEDILKEDPQDQIFESNYFETVDDGLGAVNGIYAALNSDAGAAPTFGGVYHSTYWVVQGLASDEMKNNQPGTPDYDQLDNFNFNSANTNFSDMWARHYFAISLANFAIRGISTSPIEEGMKTRLIGEASFLRGVLYFGLVRIFGEVPLMLEESSELRPDKSTLDEIYGQIIADLELASISLPESYPLGDGLGRATLGAAHGVLAKVYLKRNEWQMAIDHAESVRSIPGYGLWPDFADAFRLANENGQETIFGIGFGDGGGAISFWEVGQFNVRLLPSELGSVIPGVNAQGWQVATQNTHDAFEDGDRRKTVTFMTEVGGDALDEIYIRKYWDDIGEPSAGNTEVDFPYMRFSEVLLIQAEALNELNGGPTVEAYDAINQVRRRARFDGTSDQNVLPDLSGLTQTQFRDAILLERRREFVGEGQRWFDLVRMDKLQELVPISKPGVTPLANHGLFPIPLTELDLNPNLLPQNAGY